MEREVGVHGFHGILEIFVRAACRHLRGLGGRAHCAGERFCAYKLAGVMRLEVSVEISATRKSSGGASFCVRKRNSAAISVRFLMF